MRVTKRITDVKRHTLGYVISGKKYTRGQAVKLARRKKIDGVTAYKRDDGWLATLCRFCFPGLPFLPLVNITTASFDSVDKLVLLKLF